MTLKSKVASALSFAHRAGLSTKAAKAEDDEEKKKDEARADDDEDDSADANDDDDLDDDKKSKKARGAKADDDDGDSDDDGDAAAEEEESEDDEKRESAKAARRMERARCSAIVAHGVKTNQVVHACAYAFDTSMSVKAAIATLDANAAMQGAAGARGSSLADRMAGVRSPVLPPSAEAPASGTPSAIAALVLAAGAKARGEKA